MSRQTDELLLYTGQSEEAAPPVPPQDTERIRGRLRSLESLKQQPGWTMYIEALKYEAQHCLVSMDRADNPTIFTKAGANYFSLTMAIGWVETEIARCRALLID